METLMSKGPGRVERAIRDLFSAHPTEAFTTADLIAVVFPDIEDADKKHRVSVLRAARRVIDSDPDWRMARATLARGGLCIFFNSDNVQSFGHHRLMWSHAQVNEYKGGTIFHPYSRDELRAKVDDENHKNMISPPNGAWYRDVEIHRARRDGEHERAKVLEAERDAEFERWAAGAREMFKGRRRR